MRTYLIWGAIFAAGVYVGVQATKSAVSDRITGGVNDLADRTGFSNTTYGKPVVSQVNAFIKENFQ